MATIPVRRWATSLSSRRRSHHLSLCRRLSKWRKRGQCVLPGTPRRCIALTLLVLLPLMSLLPLFLRCQGRRHRLLGICVGERRRLAVSLPLLLFIVHPFRFFVFLPPFASFDPRFLSRFLPLRLAAPLQNPPFSIFTVLRPSFPAVRRRRRRRRRRLRGRRYALSRRCQLAGLKAFLGSGTRRGFFDVIRRYYLQRRRWGHPRFFCLAAKHPTGRNQSQQQRKPTEPSHQGLQHFIARS